MIYLPESEESDWDLIMLLRMKLKQFLYRNGMNMPRKHTEITLLMNLKLRETSLELMNKTYLHLIYVLRDFLVKHLV